MIVTSVNLKTVGCHRDIVTTVIRVALARVSTDTVTAADSEEPTRDSELQNVGV